MKFNFLHQIIPVLGILLIFQSCAPVFSELQSARTVGENKFEISPSFSSINYSQEGETDGVQNHLGIQAAYGLSPTVDIRLRYEYIWLKDDKGGEGISILGIGPKISLIENKFSVAMPIGRALGENTEDTWEIHPTLLFTTPIIKDRLELTIAPKYLVTLCKDCDDLAALNFGFSISKNFDKWAIRPEYGLLFNIGEKGHYGHLSIGFSAVLGE